MGIRDLTRWFPARTEASDPAAVRSRALLQSRLDRLLDDVASTGDPRLMGHDFGSVPYRGPAIDVFETDTEYLLEIELPGVAATDVTTHITNDSISIRGWKRGPARQALQRALHRERCYGSFERTFSLPHNVRSDYADASFADGILTIRFAKNAAMAVVESEIDLNAA